MTNFKDHLISAGITFTATFFLIISLEIQQPTFVFSRESFGALVMSAVVAATRSLAKVIYEVTLSFFNKPDTTLQNITTPTNMV